MIKLVASFAVVLVIVCMSAGYCIDVPTENAAVNVNVAMGPISTLSVDNPSMTLEINTAIAGEQPSPATSSFMYNITNNEAGKKLVGQLDAAAPSGLTIKGYSFVPPGSGGTQCGWVTLSDVPRDMVTNLGPVCAKNVPLMIELSGSVAAGVQSGSTTFTMTLTSSQ